MKKNANKVMYASAAVLAAGAVTSVKPQTVHAETVQGSAAIQNKQTDVKTTNQDLHKQLDQKTAEENTAKAQDAQAQKTIDQNQKDLTQTQDQLNKAQTEKDDAVRKVPDAQANVLTADSNNQSAQNVLANAQDQLKTAQEAQAKAQANYDASYENNVKSAQTDVNKANADVQSTQEQINVQNTKQAEALNNRQGQEDALKTNTETLNKTNEEISKTQGQVQQAQKTYDAVNKDYQPVKAELDKQAKEASDAQKAAQENAKELTQAQNELKTAQDTANKAAETINTAQAKLNSDTNALNGAKSELSTKQKQASDLTSQRDQVAKDLQTAQAKMNTAKAELDADKDAVVNTMVMPQVYKDTVKKWSTKDHTDDYYKEMEAASWIGWTQNEYKHNEAEKNHMVDLKHMSRADQIELNKFGIDLINQLRTQIGVDPWTFNESALDFANAIADRYVKDDWDSDKNGHDSAAINELAHQYGLNYGITNDGTYSKDGQYYENLMTDRFGKTEIPVDQVKDEMEKTGNPYHYSIQYLAYGPRNTYTHSKDDYTNRLDDMDHLKNQVFNSIKQLVFSDEEWLHADSLLSQDMFNNTAKGANYAAISISVKPTPDRWGFDDMPIHFINVHESMVLDPKVFNVNANIPLDSNKSDAAKQYSESLAQVNDLSAKKSNLDNQINGLTKNISDLTSRINDLTKSISDGNKTLETAKADKTNAEKTLESLPGHINDLKTEQSDLDKQLTVANERLSATQAKSVNLVNAYNTAKANLDNAINKLNGLKSDKANAEKAVNENNAQLTQIAKDLNTIDSTLSSLHAKLANAQTAKEQADTKLANAKKAYDEYVETHKDVIEALTNANAEVTAKTKAYNEAKAHAKETNDIYVKAQNELDALNKKIDSLDSAIDGYTKHIRELKTDTKKQQAIIEKNKQVHKEFEDLTAKVAKSDKDVKRQEFDDKVNKALDNVNTQAKSHKTADKALDNVDIQAKSHENANKAFTNENDMPVASSNVVNSSIANTAQSDISVSKQTPTIKTVGVVKSSVVDTRTHKVQAEEAKQTDAKLPQTGDTSAESAVLAGLGAVLGMLGLAGVSRKKKY